MAILGGSILASDIGVMIFLSSFNKCTTDTVTLMDIHKIVGIRLLCDKITNNASISKPSNLLPKSSHCQNRAMLLHVWLLGTQQ